MKILKINSSVYDYGVCAFNDSSLSIEDVFIKTSETECMELDFDEDQFSAEILEFDAELTDKDIKILNSLVDTHFEEFYKTK